MPAGRGGHGKEKHGYRGWSQYGGFGIPFVGIGKPITIKPVGISSLGLGGLGGLGSLGSLGGLGGLGGFGGLGGWGLGNWGLGGLGGLGGWGGRPTGIGWFF